VTFVNFGRQDRARPAVPTVICHRGECGDGLVPLRPQRFLMHVPLFVPFWCLSGSFPAMSETDFPSRLRVPRLWRPANKQPLRRRRPRGYQGDSKQRRDENPRPRRARLEDLRVRTDQDAKAPVVRARRNTRPRWHRSIATRLRISAREDVTAERFGTRNAPARSRMERPA